MRLYLLLFECAYVYYDPFEDEKRRIVLFVIIATILFSFLYYFKSNILKKLLPDIDIYINVFAFKEDSGILLQELDIVFSSCLK